MKHVFLLLLAANIGLFIWGYQREQTAEHKRPHILPDVGELRLLAERKAALKSVLQRESAAAPEMLLQSAEEQVQNAVAPEVGFSVNEPEPEKEAMEQAFATEKMEPDDGQLAQQEPEGLDQADEQSNAVSSSASSLEDEPKPQAGLGPITEIGQSLQTEMIVEPELLTPKRSCYRLGPILEIASVDELSNQMEGLGFNTVMHTQQVTKAKGYWVMYPAQATYEEAKQKLQEMKKAGLSDLWLFPKGEHQNAISLGLYSSRINAEKANNRAQKKGWATDVLVRTVKFDQYWLEFQAVDPLSISEESTLALHEAFPNEEFEFKRCSDVVTD